MKGSEKSRQSLLDETMEFRGKSGRKIELKEHDGTIYAYHKKCEVGKIDFAIIEVPYGYDGSVSVAYPRMMNVAFEYQRQGIATGIINYAKELYEEVRFYPDTGCGGNTDEVHYSAEGLSFKDFCERSGITNETYI